MILADKLMKILSLDTSEGRLAGRFAVCDVVSVNIGANTESENGPLAANIPLADALDAGGFAVTLLKSENLNLPRIANPSHRSCII